MLSASMTRHEALAIPLSPNQKAPASEAGAFVFVRKGNKVNDSVGTRRPWVGAFSAEFLLNRAPRGAEWDRALFNSNGAVSAALKARIRAKKILFGGAEPFFF